MQCLSLSAFLLITLPPWQCSYFNSSTPSNRVRLCGFTDLLRGELDSKQNSEYRNLHTKFLGSFFLFTCPFLFPNFSRLCLQALSLLTSKSKHLSEQVIIVSLHTSSGIGVGKRQTDSEGTEIYRYLPTKMTKNQSIIANKNKS